MSTGFLPLRFVSAKILGLIFFVFANALTPCEAQETVKARLQILNASPQAINVVWVSEDQQHHPVMTLKAGTNDILRTRVGHTHLLTDEQGNTLATIPCRVPVQAFRFDRAGQGDLAAAQHSYPQGEVLAVTAEMNVPDFYSKIIFVDNYPVVGSEQVNDHALLEAAYLIRKLMAQRPDILKAMVSSGSRMCVMSENEFTTQLPEFRWLGKRSPVPGVEGSDYWDARARGLGGSETDPYCSVAEENLLNYPGDPYSTENILIHEFAHNIHLRGVNNLDPTFDRRLKETYNQAMAKGLWKGKYASTNHHEYFAEGVQSWFDDNRENDHDHNHVNTRQELLEYDPGLAAMCKEVFGETEFRYVKTGQRLTDHLKDYQPDANAKFTWPKRLDAVKKAIVAQAQKRDRDANSAPPEESSKPKKSDESEPK